MVREESPPCNELFYGRSILRFLGRARFVSISDNPNRPAVRRTPGFDGDIRLETYGKDGLIRKHDMNLRAVFTVFVCLASTNHFAGNFSAFDHGFSGVSKVIART
jgi:hypothetical protein